MFGHALIRETLYAGMSRHRLGRLHHRVGLELEHRGEQEVGALALHFSRAGERADAERAIDYAIRAGTQATEIAAHEEAAAHYQRAVEVLDRAHPGCTRTGCWRCCWNSARRTFAPASARPPGRCSCDAAALAEQLDDSDALTRAAIGASWRYIQPPGIVEPELIALLDRALAANAAPSATRVLLLARLCGAVYYSDRREQMPTLSREATELAAQLDHPYAIGLAAAARRRAYWGPGKLERRLADSTEVLRCGSLAGDQELMLAGNAWLVVDLLERGDRVGVDAQIKAFEAGAERVRQPLFSWLLMVWRTMLALLEGRIADADRLSQAAFSIGMRQDAVTAGQYFGGQLMYARREQLQLEELAAGTRTMLASNPERLVWRAALVTLLSEMRRRDEARAELEPITDEVLRGLTPDIDWTTTITLLAEAAVGLGDRGRAELLYELLAPKAAVAVVAGAGVLCFGAAAGWLGVLALTAGDRRLAREHLAEAVEINRAMRSWLPLAYVQVEYARALGQGSAGANAARERRAPPPQRSGYRGSRGVRKPSPRCCRRSCRARGDLALALPSPPMAKTLIIAEKPSVGENLARVLPGAFKKTGPKGEQHLEGTDHVVTWAVGHLVQLADPEEYGEQYKKWRMADLPIVPKHFKLVIRDERSRKQMNVVKRLLGRDDIDQVVNACDAGREGELIFAYLYEKAGSRKPVQRLWLSSMTDAAIRSAFAALRPRDELASLEDAARSRSEADWIVGMNATRAATIRLRSSFDGAVSLGRVQTPTLAILARREQEIRAFVPEPYWVVDAALRGRR